jgi:hypothetical protein
MGPMEIQPEISSKNSLGTKSGVALWLSSSGSVSSHLPLDPTAGSVTLPSPYVFLPLPAPKLLPPVTLDVP